MGYHLQAIIGNRDLLQAHSHNFPSVVVVPLSFDLALVPVTDELLDEIGAAGGSGRFEKYTPSLANWIRRISKGGIVSYIEAEYFGGTGGQGSVVLEKEQEVLSPVHSDDAINQALRLLGVSADEFRDEFEAVGLPRHRNIEGWLEDGVFQKVTSDDLD